MTVPVQLEQFSNLTVMSPSLSAELVALDAGFVSMHPTTDARARRTTAHFTALPALPTFALTLAFAAETFAETFALMSFIACLSFVCLG